MAKQDLFRGLEVWMYDIDIAPSMMNVKEARAEYVRLAKAANKRIQRLIESKEYGKGAAAEHAMFGSVKQLKTDRQVYAALQTVARFTSRKTSSISGIKEAERRQLETMRDMGYTFLNKGNIREFGQFWKEVKKHSEYKSYDSERIVNLFKEAKRKRIDSQDLAKNFNFWIENEDKLSTMKRSESVISSAEARERLS